MNEKELKTQLSLAALRGGVSLLDAQEFFQWITTDTNRTLYDETPVSIMEDFLGRYKVPFHNRCRENGIETMGQLIKMGKTEFRAMHLVGNGLTTKVADVLDTHYGAAGW